MTLTVRSLRAAPRTLMLLLGLLALADTANAACSNPAGVAGDMAYSTTGNAMVYCDNTNWISMAGGVSLTVNTSGGGGATPAGSTNDIQFNSSGALAADTGNFTYSSGLLKVTNISATAISASGQGTFGSLLANGGMTVTGVSSLTTVSASTVSVTALQIGAGGTCATGTAGSVRYNTTSNTVDYCTGTAWMSMGPSSTQPIAFYAHNNGVNETITASTDTKLTFSSKDFDTNSNFSTATSRFTPNVPGKYLITLAIRCTNTTSSCAPKIYKNGASLFDVVDANSNGSHGQEITAIVDMNGSTDYLEAYAFATGTTISGTKSNLFFQGVLLAPQGGSGGTATPAGSTNDIQFNSGGLLAADTGNFTYTAATGTLSATTISASVVNIAASASTIANIIGGSGNMIASGSAVVSTSSNGSITFFTGGAQRGVVSSGGLWGLGSNATPADVVDAQQDGNTYSRIRIRNANTGASAGAGFYFGTDTDTAYAAYIIANGANNTANFAGAKSLNMVNYYGPIAFFSAAGAITERMRIDTSGNVSINGGNLFMNVSAWTATPNPGVTVANSGQVNIGNSAQASGWQFMNFSRSGTAIGSITQNGTAAVAYNTTSDRRVKENIIDSREGLQKLMRIGVKDFSFKADPSHTIVNGFIAQDLNKVYPEAVTTNGDNGEAPLKDKSKIWQVDYGRVTPLIVKAVQDLNRKTDAEVSVLKADSDNLRRDLKVANDNAQTMRNDLDSLRAELRELKQHIK